MKISVYKQSTQLNWYINWNLYSRLKKKKKNSLFQNVENLGIPWSLINVAQLLSHNHASLQPLIPVQKLYLAGEVPGSNPSNGHQELLKLACHGYHLCFFIYTLITCLGALALIFSSISQCLLASLNAMLCLIFNEKLIVNQKNIEVPFNL